MGFIAKIRKYRWAVIGRKKIRECVLEKKRSNQAIKIILGAGHHELTGTDWINTDLPQFDITNAKHWQYLFGNCKIDNLFAEHVFEHLTFEQNKKALLLAQKYLAENGTIRIAVPDRNNMDELYQKGVRVGGTDIGASDHKVFFNLYDYEELLKETRFKITPLEYFDRNNVLKVIDYNDASGFVLRSKKNKYHYAPIPNYSSLIIDLNLRHP